MGVIFFGEIQILNLVWINRIFLIIHSCALGLPYRSHYSFFFVAGSICVINVSDICPGQGQNDAYYTDEYY